MPSAGPIRGEHRGHVTWSPPITAELLIIQRCQPQSPDGGVKTPCQLLGGFNIDIDVHSIQFIQLCTHISFTGLLHKTGKLGMLVCKTFTDRGVGLNLRIFSILWILWININAKIGKVLRTPYQLSIKQGLGSASGYLIVDRIRREEDIFMWSFNISCDRSDWGEPNKTSSEYNFACHCFSFLYFAEKLCHKNATHARSQNTLHSLWPDMCPVPRSGPVP